MDLIEKVSRAIDPKAWDEAAWNTLTRSGLNEMHSARQKANEAAKRVLTVFDWRVE